MENLERRIIEIRSKELGTDNVTPKWRLCDNTAGRIYSYQDSLQQYESTVFLEKETKRGFTISYTMAGVWLEIFISRSSCIVVYELD